MDQFNNMDIKNFLAAMDERRSKKNPQEIQDGQKDLDAIISEIEETYSEKAPFTKEEKERLKKIKEEQVPEVDDFKPEIDIEQLTQIVKEMVANGEVDPMGVGMDKELAAEREKNMAKKSNPQEEIDLLEGMIDERELEQPNKGLMAKAMMKMKEKVDKLKSTKK